VVEFVAVHAVAAERYAETRKLVGLNLDIKYSDRFYKILDKASKDHGFSGSEWPSSSRDVVSPVTQAATTKVAVKTSAKPKAERIKEDLTHLKEVCACDRVLMCVWYIRQLPVLCCFYCVHCVPLGRI
jgi:hypothetical protein